MSIQTRSTYNAFYNIDFFGTYQILIVTAKILLCLKISLIALGYF